MSSPLKQISHRRLLPFPGSAKGSRLRTNNEFLQEHDRCDLQPDTVKSYLSNHSVILEEYILDYVSIEKLEDWLFTKKQNLNRATSCENVQLANRPSLQDRYKNGDIASLQKSILADVAEKPDFLPLLHELMNVIASGVKAETCSLFAVRSGSKELCLFVPPTHESSEYTLKLYGPIGTGSTVAAYVANEKKAILLKDLLGDERFPRGIGLEGCLMFSVICVPFTLPTDDLLCVMEFVRTNKSPAFTDSDLQNTVSAVAWTGATMYQCQINKALNNQAELNEFLLEVSRIIFDDIVQMDRLIEKIMVYTKNLVNADRCALFLVDVEKQELYCNLLDQGRVKDGKPVFSKGEEIRFPITKGVAGYVARTSEIVNIDDPYNHPFFNRDIDRQTGYITRSILCMPIISKGITIGVVQMVNKKSEGGFTKADESSFKMFSVYCALALHYSKVYSQMQLRSAQFRVAMEHLSYHLVCADEEVKALSDKPLVDSQDMPPDLASFFYIYKDETKDEIPILPQLFIHMMRNLCGKRSFDMKKMCNFVMTVKKNYRTVPYHNWTHGWLVAHGMYAMLEKIMKKGILSPLRVKGLMIASLCHDIDHRGFNNAFLQKFNEPLAQLYESSTMEQHHYNHTVTIMQQEGNEIFAGKMTAEEYKELLGYIRHAIIATDLAKYLSESKTFTKLCQSQAFSLEREQHLDATVAVMMTAADLMVMCKPWDVQQIATNNLYKEFHMQGDMEKIMGSEPIPMMDRDKIDSLPKNQVNFLKFVCLPVYDSLSHIFPEFAPLTEACNDNMDQWQRIVEGKSTKLWEQAKSIVQTTTIVVDEEGEEDSA